jgi:hypothetical protein
MAKCPVCNTEYIQGQDELCPKCRLPFNVYFMLYAPPSDGILAEKLVSWGRSLLQMQLNEPTAQSQLSKSQQAPQSENQAEIQAKITKTREEQQNIIRRLSKLEESDRERKDSQVQIEQQRSQMISGAETRLKQQIEREKLHLLSHISQLEEQLKKEKHERSHSNASLSDLQNQLRQLKEERSHFQSQISNLQTQLQQNVSQTYSKYERWCQDTNQSVDSLGTKLAQFETEVARLKAYSQNNQRLNNVTQINLPTSPSRSTTPTESSQVNVSQPLGWDESNLVTKYNNDPNIFTNKIEVSETKESNDNRRSGSNQSPILETSRRGNYWIINESGFDYLVPSPNLKLNEFNSKTVEAFFKCHNYGGNSSRNVRLYKPAQVSALPGQEKWELIQPGVIQFD